jgi:DNA repair exonuclease SbcCD nuclease subunit
MTDILLIGDIHVTPKNTDTISMLFTQVKSTIVERKIKYCVVMGDILHTHEKLHTTALNCALKFLRGIADICPNTFVLVGNHDYINNSQFLTENHWMNCLKKDKIKVIDTVINVKVDKNVVCMCPYVPDGKFLSALEGKEEKKDEKADLYLSHVCINGMKMGGIVVKGADDWKESYPPLFVGHEHTFQVVAKNCICTGSCTSTSFSESVDKYLIIVNINKKVWSYDKIPLDLPRKKTLYFDSVLDLKTQHEDEKLSLLDEKSLCEYKIIIHGSKDEYDAFAKTTLFTTLSSKSKIVYKEKLLDTENNIEGGDIIIPNNKCEDFFAIFSSRFRETNPTLVDIYNECSS